MNKILVGYLSKTGSTKEVALRIKQLLDENQIDNDLIDLSQSVDLNQYNKIILGCPINGMKLLPEFHQFVNIYQEELKHKIFGFYVLAYIYHQGRNFWKKAMNKDIERVRKILLPDHTIVFDGKIKDKMPNFMQFIFGVPKDLPFDNLKWNQIDSWIEQLITDLK